MRRQLEEALNGGGAYSTKPSGIIRIPSGSKLLDLALGGGWAQKKVINIVGDSSTGKSLLATEMCAIFADMYPDGVIKYRDCEDGFDEEYASDLGVPVERIDFGEDMDTVEEFANDLRATVEEAKKHGQPILYILDSLDSLSDEAEMKDKKSFGGTAKAKAMSQFFRKQHRDLERYNITLVIISQLRDAINVMFGEKKMRTGGKALNYYCTHVVWLAQVDVVRAQVGDLNPPTGIVIRIKVKKNRAGVALREVEVTIVFKFGVDDAGSCLDYIEAARPKTREEKAKAESKAAQTGLMKKKKRARPAHITKRLNALKAMSNVQYWNEMDAIYREVEEAWHRVERAILPTRRKYGSRPAPAAPTIERTHRPAPPGRPRPLPQRRQAGDKVRKPTTA